MPQQGHLMSFPLMFQQLRSAPTLKTNSATCYASHNISYEAPIS